MNQVRLAVSFMAALAIGAVTVAGSAAQAPAPESVKIEPAARLQIEPMPLFQAETGVELVGRVQVGWDDGPGLAGVRLYQAVDAYPTANAPSVISDRTGAYSFGFLPLEAERDQTVYVRPALDGYVFLPEWRWYDYQGAGRVKVHLDFVAEKLGTAPENGIVLPLVPLGD